MFAMALMASGSDQRHDKGYSDSLSLLMQSIDRARGTNCPLPLDRCYLAPLIEAIRITGIHENKITPVSHEQVPKSLHHLIVGWDGMLYASSFNSNEVFRAVRADGVWHW